jgi:hypothetical protein
MDAAVQLPTMSHAQGPDLAITGFVAIEKKEIGDPVVRSSDGNAAFVNYGDASHQRDLRKLGFQGQQLCWRAVAPPRDAGYLARARR